MVQPTVNVAVDEGQAAPAQFCCWEVSDASLNIEIRLDMVERLEAELVQTSRSITRRGSEIGGLLLGRVSKGSKPTVSIEDYQIVACDYSRGPLYLLGESDRRRLAEAVGERESKVDGDFTVVGYFRSNTRKDLLLDEEDQAIIRELFPGEHKVAMLVKPVAGRGHMAGLYVRKGEGILGEADLKFPFSRAELLKNAAEGRVRIRLATPARAASVSESLHENREAETVRLTPYRARQAKPADPQVSRPALPDLPFARVSAGPGLADGASLPWGREEASVLPAARPASISGLLKTRGIRASLAAIPMVLIAGLAWSHWRDEGRAAAQGPVYLGLSVERSGEEMLVRWNRGLPLIATADRAIISIKDGDRREDLELDLEQLRSGRLLYSPLTNDVSFRLEVTDLKAGRSAAERLRVFGWRSKATVPDGMHGAHSFPGETEPSASAESHRPYADSEAEPEAAGRRPRTRRPS